MHNNAKTYENLKNQGIFLDGNHVNLVKIGFLEEQFVEADTISFQSYGSQ